MTTTYTGAVVREALISETASMYMSAVVREALIGGSAATKNFTSQLVRESLQSNFSVRRAVPFKIGW